MIPLTVPEFKRLLAAALARPSPPGHAGGLNPSALVSGSHEHMTGVYCITT